MLLQIKFAQRCIQTIRTEYFNKHIILTVYREKLNPFQPGIDLHEDAYEQSKPCFSINTLWF